MLIKDTTVTKLIWKMNNQVYVCFSDIIDDDTEAGRWGSARRRPKTPASVTWLFRSLREDILRLQSQYRAWKHHVKAKHSECLQVEKYPILNVRSS